MRRLDRGRGPPENRESRPADTGAALETPQADIGTNTTTTQRQQARHSSPAPPDPVVVFPDMSPLDRPLMITKALPWLKLARFGDLLSPKGSLRHDRNVLTIDGAH